MFGDVELWLASSSPLNDERAVVKTGTLGVLARSLEGEGENQAYLVASERRNHSQITAA